ncbi:MAG: metalloregulator ArsR/SmtB family transcription factor [Chloroflexota bacterium]
MTEQLHPMKILSTRIDLAPIHNILHSMALLNEGESMPLCGQWVQQTITTLSPEQQQRNRLVFEGLREVFVRDQDSPDFPTYLAWLAAQNPFALRDVALEWLCHSFDGSISSIQPDDLLTNKDTYTRCVMRLRGVPDVDPAILAKAHALLNDPPAMYDLIVQHLTELWEQTVAPEWGRGAQGKGAPLPQAMRAFQSYLADKGLTAAETLRVFTGRSVPDMPLPAVDVTRVVLVPSPHVGRQMTTWLVGTTLHVFFAPPPQPENLLRSSPVGHAEMLTRLTALADETRLRILELVAQSNEISAQEIMARLSLTQSTVSRHLKQLRPYLVERRGEGASKVYTFSPLQFDLTLSALEQLSAGQTQYSELVLPEESEQYPLELRRFLDNEGRVTHWPAKVKDKLVLLEYLAAKFEPAQTYSEKEVNALLLQHMHPTFRDFVTIRRALYDYQWFDRERDGSQYWLAPQRHSSGDES